MRPSSLIICMISLILSACSTQTVQPTHLHYDNLDESDYSRLLSQHVRQGHVDYSGFRNEATFAYYLEQIAALNPDTLTTTEQRLSFLINAYNALSIQGILNGRSPSSFFGKVGFFVLEDYVVNGQEINLYDLEHEVLRPLGEPRIHFALVCASFSCPALRSEAYDPQQLEQQLEQSAKAFINDTSKNRFDIATKTAYLSKIFSWFEEDFLATGLSLQQYLAQYVDNPDIAAQLNKDAYRIKHLDYDWQLNGQLE